MEINVMPVIGAVCCYCLLLLYLGKKFCYYLDFCLSIVIGTVLLTLAPQFIKTQVSYALDHFTTPESGGGEQRANGEPGLVSFLIFSVFEVYTFHDVKPRNSPHPVSL